MILELAGTHTEAVLNKATKDELVQLVLKTEINMTEIFILTAVVIQLNSNLKNSYLKQLKLDVPI